MITDDQLERALAEFARAETSRRAPPHVEALVVERFDRQRRRQASFTYARNAVAVTVLAAAASVMIYFNVTVIRSPLPTLSTDAQAGNHAERRPIAPPDAPQESPQVLSSDRSPRIQPPARVNGSAVWKNVALIVPGDADVVQVVHIRLPRAMLPVLGVPVIDPDATGTVNVELLLGNDGLARTIHVLP
jgi:hypothetical protein